MTLKTFLKHFDKMQELHIRYFYDPESDNICEELFKGYTFDDGARKKLKKLFKQGWELERNSDGESVFLVPYINEHRVALIRVYINVRPPKGRRKK